MLEAQRQAPDEEQGLVVNTQHDESLIQATQKPIAVTQSTTWRLISFGANSLIISIHMIGNGLILASLGPNDEAAAGLISTTQGVINGIVFGILSSTAVELGVALGKKESETDTSHDSEIAAIIKTSWLTGGVLSLLSTGFLISTRAIMPYVVAPATGQAVGDFFTTFAIGGFSEPMGGNAGIIIAQVEKNMWLPLLATLAYRLPALGLSYVFARTLGLGALGAGLGPGIVGVVSFVGTQLLFVRQKYRRLGVYQCSIPNFKQHLKSFLNGGWKLALQRLSEWGNLFAIATTVGALSNTELEALTPAIQANTLVAFAVQGMGQAAMMFFVQDCKKKQQHLVKFKQTLDKNELEQFGQLQTVNKHAFIKNNAAGLVLSIGLSTGIYFARQPIIHLFLGANIAPEQFELSESLLLYMLIGLVPDSIRIVSGGILRGWGDLLFPTLMSLLIMTIFGVPVGAGLSYLRDEDALCFLWVRIVTTFLSAAINVFRFYKHFKNDQIAYQHGKNLLDIVDALEKWENKSRLIPFTDQDNLSEILREAGFQIIDPHDSQVTLFSLMHHQGYGESSNELKRLVADELADQIPKLIKQFKTRDAVIKLLETKSEKSNKLILETLAKVLKINITVIHHDRSIFKAKGDTSNRTIIYLAYNSNKEEYYSLNGKPNTHFPSLVGRSTTSLTYSGSPFHHQLLDTTAEIDIISADNEQQRLAGTIQRAYGTQ